MTKRKFTIKLLSFIFINLLEEIATSFRGRRSKRGDQKKELRNKYRINQYIRVSEVRLVDQKGEMLGIVSSDEAVSKAKEAGLDLVEISPKAKPPVCKIIDYGKFLYEQKKKEQQQKKASKGHEMKGIRLSFRIGPGDLERQQRRAETFLTDGHSVRVQLILRGREKAHKNLAFDKLNTFLTELEPFGVIEQKPKFSGFQIIAIIKPVTGKK